MDHLPATPRDQWRRVQLARYLIDYRGVRVEHMQFDDAGRVKDFGLPKGELDGVINDGCGVQDFRLSWKVRGGHLGV
jgi:biotin synthase